MRGKEQGAVTVFLSLILIVVLSASLILQEVMSVYLGYGQIAHGLEGAGQHLLADYNQALAERYDLYALDETYNGYGAEELLTRAQDYLEYYLNPSLLTGQSSGFLTVDVEDVSVDARAYINDQENSNLMQQISDYAKLAGIQEGIDFLREQLAGLTTWQEQTDEWKQDLKNKAKEEEEGRRQAAEAGTQSLPSDTPEAQQPVRDPRDELTELLSGGMLYYITDGDTSLGSESTLEGADTGTFMELKNFLTLFRKQESLEWHGDITEKAELLLYLNRHFRNYCEAPGAAASQTDQYKYQCEMEYLICGKESDADNLNHLAGKFIALRFPMNFTVAAGDPSMRQEALTLAAALAGAAGIPPVVTAVQYLLLGAWSYGETLLEMRGLLQGKSIGAVKTGNQWNLSLHHIGSGHIECQNIKGGMAYEDYLNLFAALTPKKDILARMLQIIEDNLQIDNPDFLIGSCVCGFQLTSRNRIHSRYSICPGLMEAWDWYSYETSVRQQY